MTKKEYKFGLKKFQTLKTGEDYIYITLTCDFETGDCFNDTFYFSEYIYHLMKHCNDGQFYKTGAIPKFYMEYIYEKNSKDIYEDFEEFKYEFDLDYDRESFCAEYEEFTKAYFKAEGEHYSKPGEEKIEKKS